jgi:hypothetical protein
MTAEFDSFCRRSFISIVEATLDESALSGWEVGPAPFANSRIRADEDRRATYFDQRIRRALYSADGPQRRHRFEGPGIGAWGDRGVSVTAVEVGRLRFTTEPGRALLIVHGTLPSDEPIEALWSLARLSGDSDGDVREWYSRLGGGLVDIDARTTRATTAAFLTPAGDLPRVLPDDYEGWTPTEQWLWLAASATPFERYPPDPVLRDDLAKFTVRISRDWEALVLRDGVGFLGRRPDQGEGDPFFDDAEVYFHSIYLDALVLGVAQKAALRSIADDVADLDDPHQKPRELRALERRVARFRNVYWWTHLSAHGPANELTRLYSRQHRLDALATQIFEEIGEHSRQIQTAAAERTNALLGLITIVGLPITAVIGLLTLLKLDSPVLVIVVTVVAMLVLVGAFFLVLPDHAASLRRNSGSEES